MSRIRHYSTTRCGLAELQEWLDSVRQCAALQSARDPWRCPAPPSSECHHISEAAWKSRHRVTPVLLSEKSDDPPGALHQPLGRDLRHGVSGHWREMPQRTMRTNSEQRQARCVRMTMLDTESDGHQIWILARPRLPDARSSTRGGIHTSNCRRSTSSSIAYSMPPNLSRPLFRMRTSDQRAWSSSPSTAPMAAKLPGQMAT